MSASFLTEYLKILTNLLAYGVVAAWQNCWQDRVLIRASIWPYTNNYLFYI